MPNDIHISKVPFCSSVNVNVVFYLILCLILKLISVIVYIFHTFLNVYYYPSLEGKHENDEVTWHARRGITPDLILNV